MGRPSRTFTIGGTDKPQANSRPNVRSNVSEPQRAGRENTADLTRLPSNPSLPPSQDKRDPKREARYAQGSSRLEEKERKLNRESVRLTEKYKLPSERLKLEAKQAKLEAKRAKLLEQKQKLAAKYVLEAEAKKNRCHGKECYAPDCSSKYKHGCKSGGSPTQCGAGQVWNGNACSPQTADDRCDYRRSVRQMQIRQQLEEVHRLKLQADLACTAIPGGAECLRLTKLYELALQRYNELVQQQSMGCF